MLDTKVRSRQTRGEVVVWKESVMVCQRVVDL